MKLKSIFGSLVAAATVGIFAGTASAATLAEVGVYDTKIAQTNVGGGGAAAEEAWIESIIGPVNYTQLGDESAGAFWEAVTDGVAGDFAFDFGGLTPTHFLVKVGGGGGAGADNTDFLFLNNASLEWAFLNLSVFGAGVSLTNIGIISHLGITDGGTTVPEPGILALLGVGLALVGFTRRRKIA